MSNSEELEFVYKLLNEYRLEEALQKVKDIEQKENSTIEETLKTLTYKIWSYWGLGQLELAFKLTEDLYQKSQKMEKPLYMLDALFFKDWIFYGLGGELEEFYKNLEDHERLFNSIPREESVEFQEREAYLLMMKGARAHYKYQKYNLADTRSKYRYWNAFEN